MKWKDKLLKKLERDLKNDNDWKVYIEKLNGDIHEIGIHVAVFSEPILAELLKGNKTVESRFSLNRVTPFGKVHTEDVVLVKRSGGPIVAVFVAGTVNSYSNLTPTKVTELRTQYHESLGLSINDEFWEVKKKSKFVTLIRIRKLKILLEYSIEKKDRTGWVVVQERKVNDIFEQRK